MKTRFLTAFSETINAYLGLDPESKRRLQKLQGKAITIELLPFHFIFQCEFTSDGVKIHTDELLHTHAQLCCTPLQMLGMMLAKDNRHRFFADDLSIEGDAELGQHVVELFDELHIDWEEYLSHVTGDVSAHHISRFVNNVKDWLTQTEHSFTQNINEYIHEEANWLPVNEALQDFFSEVDRLRMDIDRIEAKINFLRNEITGNEAAK